MAREALQNLQKQKSQQKKSLQNKFPADSPMADFMDVRLASPTKQEYISKLKMFFDSLKLHGSLDKQSREFLVQAKGNGGKEWAQNGLKYFIRDKKQRVENGELARVDYS